MTDTRVGPGTRLSARERVAVALDVENAAEARAARDALGNALGLAKVGSALFVREGMELVTALQDGGTRVFLDLKFHDIPSTVAHACVEAGRLGVRFVDVHAAGGAAMIEAARQAMTRAGRREG